VLSARMSAIGSEIRMPRRLRTKTGTAYLPLAVCTYATARQTATPKGTLVGCRSPAARAATAAWYDRARTMSATACARAGSARRHGDCPRRRAPATAARSSADRGSGSDRRPRRARRGWGTGGIRSPRPGTRRRCHRASTRTVPSIAIGSSSPGKLSTSWTCVPTGSERFVVTKVPPEDRLSVKSPFPHGLPWSVSKDLAALARSQAHDSSSRSSQVGRAAYHASSSSAAQRAVSVNHSSDSSIMSRPAS